jgi:hypothetical protein
MFFFFFLFFPSFYFLPYWQFILRIIICQSDSFGYNLSMNRKNKKNNHNNNNNNFLFCSYYSSKNFKSSSIYIYKRARKGVCWLFVALLASMYAPHARLRRVVCRRSSFSSLVSQQGLLLALSSCRREQIEEQYHIIVDDNDVVCMVSCVVFSFLSYSFLCDWFFFASLVCIYIHIYIRHTNTGE